MPHVRQCSSAFAVALFGVLASWSLAAEPPLPQHALASPTGGAGFQEPDLRHIDTTVAEFMRRHQVPGLAVAVAKDGRLVLAKGFGYADQEQQVELTPTHLFRIASVSKPITAIAILTLVEQGRLALTDKVFGPGGILAEDFGLPQEFPHKGDMTVLQLLQHVGGGWSNSGRDPMFRHLELNHPELIKTTLAEAPLAHRPGEKYAYSNFGYLLLGRIIEKRSGQTYATFVQEAVLRKAGVKDMHISGDALADRRPNEVRYYDDDAQAPYRVRVSRMDAHGGWLANPVDLLRLLVRVDGFDTKPDLLRPESLTAMTTASTANPHYALGWSVNESHNWWHSGSLPGTYTFLVRAHHGFCWSLLLNRRKTSGEFNREVDQLGWKLIEGVKSWPTYDLFAD